MFGPLKLRSYLIVFVILLITHGSLFLWGLWEHEHRLTAQANESAAKANLQVCANASADQQRAVEALKAGADAAKARADAASKRYEQSATQATAEHQRMLALMAKPSKDQSCDAAWDLIEKGN